MNALKSRIDEAVTEAFNIIARYEDILWRFNETAERYVTDREGDETLWEFIERTCDTHMIADDFQVLARVYRESRAAWETNNGKVQP